MSSWRRESVFDVYSLTLGAFLFVSPWLFSSTHTVMGHVAWMISILIVSFSLATLIAFVEWKEWCILVFGICLAVSPWILGFQNTATMKINVGIGLLIAYLAALELSLIRYSPP